MKITEKLKVLLKSVLSIQLAKVVTDKATLIYDAEELVVGTEVFIKNENEEIVPATDGEYITDEVTIVVIEGKVAEIIEKEVEETVEEVIEAEEIIEEPAEKPIEEEVIVEEITEIPTVKLEEILEVITALNNKVSALEGKVTELEERLAKVEKEPIAEPIEEETVVEETKMSKLSYLKKK